MNIVTIITNGAGLLSLGILLVGSFLAIKSGALKLVGDTQNNAISALQGEMVVLRNRLEDKDEENALLQKKVNHLEQTIDTICIALKRRNIIISVQGEMINIEDTHGGSTTARIRRGDSL